MNSETFQAFGDELTKIAFFKSVGNAFKDALGVGWHGYGPAGASTRQTWMGQGVAPAAERAQMGRLGKAWDTATSLGGLTKRLPVGAKSMMLAGSALAARDALRTEDPSGLDRSRAERLTGLAGNTVGGLAGTGALLRTAWGKKNPFLANVVGGIGGGVIGEKVLTSPWKHNRNLETQRMGAEARQQQVLRRRQELAQQANPSMNPGEVPA